MNWTYNDIRQTSGEPVPWKNHRVAVIRIDQNGSVWTSHTVTGKRDLISSATPKALLLVAWPGEWSQDVFVIDDRAEALAALSPKAKPWV